jgi:dethiobiotin synthetase
MTDDLFVTGTDTGVGKTVLASLLVASLNRRYWKPIQTGASEGTDRAAVMKCAGVTSEHTHPEVFLFDSPVSPHLAAEQQGKRIDLESIRRPRDSNPIVIEGAGGVLVPINEKDLMIDLMRRLEAPIVIAARTTLGTINHSLLTIDAARNANLRLMGVVMVGMENSENRKAIERYGKVRVVGTIPWLESINRSSLIRVFNQHFDKTAFV